MWTFEGFNDVLGLDAIGVPAVAIMSNKITEERADLEFAAILGLNFEIDNNIRLVLPGPAGGATGYLSVP